MNAKTLAQYEARAQIIKALAHPARLMIVDELSKHGERCVCELTEMIGSDILAIDGCPSCGNAWFTLWSPPTRTADCVDFSPVVVTEGEIGMPLQQLTKGFPSSGPEDLRNCRLTPMK